MVMPKKGHVKLVAYVPPDFKSDVDRESKSRDKTLGELIQEAFASRVVMIRKEKK